MYNPGFSFKQCLLKTSIKLVPFCSPRQVDANNSLSWIILTITKRIDYYY